MDRTKSKLSVSLSNYIIQFCEFLADDYEFFHSKSDVIENALMDLMISLYCEGVSIDIANSTLDTLGVGVSHPNYDELHKMAFTLAYTYLRGAFPRTTIYRYLYMGVLNEPLQPKLKTFCVNALDKSEYTFNYDTIKNVKNVVLKAVSDALN